ncbi:MAG: T9SS type A sorting domain-containing protein [Bacteroidota bacterium]
MKKITLTLLTLFCIAIEVSSQCNPTFYDGFETGSPNPAWLPGTGHTMTVNNANPAVGIYNLDLTGTSGHYMGPYATFTSGQPTYISWRIKSSNTSNANAYFVVGDANTSTNNGILFCYITTGGFLRFFSSTGYNHPISANTWYHVEARNLNWTARTMDIYVNNALILSAWPFRSATTTAVDRLFIYNLNSSTSNYDQIIIGNGSPLLITGTSQNVSCNGGSNGSATVSVSGGTAPYTYSWAPSGGTNATASGLSAGTYTCTVTDAGSCTITQTLTITQPPALSATLTQTNVSCNGGSNGSATVTPAGGTPAYAYNWAPSGGTAATASGLAAGTYTCTVTDANGCTLAQAVTITQPPAMSATSSQVNASCNGSSDGSATVTPNGGTPAYTYNWTPSGGTAATASGLAAGTYTCTVTDANGCTITQSVTITEPAALSSSFTSTDVDCFGNSSGSITLTVNGGTPGYSYAWAPIGGTNAVASGLAAGSYTCTVTDANNCTLQAVVNINQPAVISANASATSPSFCAGGCTDITISASGGTGPYTYLWTPGNMTGSTENVCPAATTTYTCSVTDASGCTQNATVTVTVNSLPVITYSQSPSLVCVTWPAFTLSAATPSGGTYSGPGVSGSTFDPSAAGQGTWNIVYTYTDGNGCTDSVTQQITVDLCTGTGNLVSGTDFTIYPNPFSGFFIIENITPGSRLTITNALGENVYSSLIMNSSARIEKQDLEAGVYFIEIKNEQGVSVKKVIKE